MLFFRRKRIVFRILLPLLLLGLLVTGCTGALNPHGWAGPTASDNTLYVISEKKGEFLGVDLSNPNNFPQQLTPKLKKEGSSLFGCSPPEADLVSYGTPLVSGGVAYIGAYDGTIYASNAKTGAAVWQRPVETKGPIVASPALEGNSLIIASGKKLYAINATDGTPLWPKPFEAKGNIWSTPLIYRDRIYFGSLGHRFYAVDLKSGELYRQESFDASVAAAPVIADGTIYFGTFENKFYALDPDTLDSKWAEPFEGTDWFWARAVYSGGTVFAASIDGKVYAIDAATGRAKWDAPVLTGGRIRASLVLAGNTLLVAADDSKIPRVYGLDPQTGRDRWSPADLGRIMIDPWVDGTTVYFQNRGDELFGLNAETGARLWSVALNRK